MCVEVWYRELWVTWKMSIVCLRNPLENCYLSPNPLYKRDTSFNTFAAMGGTGAIFKFVGGGFKVQGWLGYYLPCSMKQFFIRARLWQTSVLHDTRLGLFLSHWWSGYCAGVDSIGSMLHIGATAVSFTNIDGGNDVRHNLIVWTKTPNQSTWVQTVSLNWIYLLNRIKVIWHSWSQLLCFF